MSKYTCQTCNAPTDLIYCDRCDLEMTKHLLSSPDWVANAKTRSGDFPNESMFDTIQKRYRALTTLER